MVMDFQIQTLAEIIKLVGDDSKIEVQSICLEDATLVVHVDDEFEVHFVPCAAGSEEAKVYLSRIGCSLRMSPIGLAGYTDNAFQVAQWAVRNIQTLKNIGKGNAHAV